MITDPVQRARRQRVGIMILLASFTSTSGALGVINHSVAVGLMGVAMTSLVMALLVLQLAAGPEWAPRHPLRRWERRTVLWLMAATGCVGVLFLIVGAATHHGSWLIGLIGVATALASGAVAVRAILWS